MTISSDDQRLATHKNPTKPVAHIAKKYIQMPSISVKHTLQFKNLFETFDGLQQSCNKSHS